jgi:cytidyltransferase-like protein
MRLFENALRFGTRLYVGVCNDEDCEVYKRRPIMTHKERCEAVAACKFVHEVIPNAPCFDLPVVRPRPLPPPPAPHRPHVG